MEEMTLVPLDDLSLYISSISNIAENTARV